MSPIWLAAVAAAIGGCGRFGFTSAPDADANGDAGTFSCATLVPAPVFCDDFERDSVLGEWSDMSLLGGGMITIDSTTSTSPTRSLLCTTPASATTDTFGATLHHVTFPLTASGVDFSFDENIASAVDMNQFDLFRVILHMPDDPTSGSLEIALTVEPTVTYIDENDYRVTPTVYISHDYSRVPAFGAWEHFAMHLTLIPSPHVTVVLGSDTVVDDDLTSPNIVASSVELELGLYHSFVPGAARAGHFDNVVLDQP